MGIEVVQEFDEVCRRADLLVADNTSVIYEFAATGRPVVLLDPPWYDRNVGHGLRFWTASHVGLHVTDPRTLTDMVTEALSARHWRDQEDALDMVFSHRDHAAERAAVTLLDWVGEQRMAA
jgi:CDP-glycerol glycerophosphotransferase (TagB/SpsB family)